MVEGTAALIVFGPSTGHIVVSIAATAFALLLAIPAIILFPLIDEMETELSARGVLEPDHPSISQRVPRYVCRMMLIFAALIGAGMVSHR